MSSDAYRSKPARFEDDVPPLQEQEEKPVVAVPAPPPFNPYPYISPERAAKVALLMHARHPWLAAAGFTLVVDQFTVTLTSTRLPTPDGVFRAQHYARLKDVDEWLEVFWKTYAEETLAGV